MSGDGSMIADSARIFLSRIGGVARARKLRDSGMAFDAGAWNEMAKLGWFGLVVPEEAGGLGLGGHELVALMETLGAQLAGEPVGNSIAASVLLSRAEGSSSLLEEVIAGSAMVALVLDASFKLAGGRVSGLSRPVVSLAEATHALIEITGENGAVYVVPLRSTGVELRTQATVDGRTVSELHLDLPLEALSRIKMQNVSLALGNVQAVARLAAAAYLVGLADAAFAIALEYLKTRKQFGVAIGSFQALQHRAATVFVRIASVRALISECARTFGTERLDAASAAAACAASEMALQVTKECIQFHGAIGFADEHDIGLYLRRAMSTIASIGDAGSCLDAFSKAASVGTEKISSTA
jgi:alkylation response protein AidB-like acyl-CoA dehydrogenase